MNTANHRPNDHPHKPNAGNYVQRLSKLLFFGILAYALYITLAQISGALGVVLFSLMLAYVLDPLVDWFEKRRIPRVAAIGLIVFVCALSLIGMALWIIPPIITEFRGLADRVVAWLNSDTQGLLPWIGKTFGVEAAPIEQLKDKLREAAPEVIGRVGNWVAGAATSALSGISSFLNLIIVPVLVFYFLRDFDTITDWVCQQIPPRYRSIIVPRAQKANGIVADWVNGQLQVAVMLAVIYVIGLSIVGIKLAIPVGIISGFLNIIPYLGTTLGIVLALLLTLMDWNGIGAPLGVVGVFVAAQLLEGYVLTPRIVGEKVGLSPVATLIALLIGGEAMGLMGLVIAVPIAGALKVFVGEALDWYRESKLFAGNEAAHNDSDNDSSSDVACSTNDSHHS